MIAEIKTKRVKTARWNDKTTGEQVKVEETIFEVKLNSRGQALARLERIMGMNVDQVRINALDALPEDELDRRLAAIAQIEQARAAEEDEGQVIDVTRGPAALPGGTVLG